MKRLQIIGDADSPAAAGQPHPVIGYVRVSTLDTAKQTLSPDAQAKIIREYAHFRSMGDVEIISERGSAKNIAGRPELQRILKMCRAGQVKDLIVQDQTRLFREVRQALDVFAELQDLGVTVHSAVDFGAIDATTATGELMRDMKLVLGQYERRQIGERTRRALRATKMVVVGPDTNAALRDRAARGKMLTGPHAPYGYRWKGHKKTRTLVPYWPEMRAIKRAKELHAQGLGAVRISNIMHQEGVRNRLGRPLTYNAVQRLYESNVYMEPPNGTETARQHVGEASADVLQGVPRPEVHGGAPAET